MHELTKTAPSPRPELYVATEGEFMGWQTWIRDSFENHIGPFWHRLEADGAVRCAFRVEKKHLNGSGNVHGGCFMAFADYCLFAIGRNALQGRGVTVNFGCEFLDAGHEGELIECTGEVTRAGGSLIFLRGQMMAAERLLFTFSGTIKRAKWKSPPQPNA
ncbi:PaaI family thioesterase [Bradyrhizobium sp. BR 10289]|uniref:PaaI family thioesterase n=1 Tax=Bradyrhizobium sp. BR 10289 TaxID=2749993 RepID=UPI001C644F94|nr:PaaI family thioesterase [Bradyrhizobium sp. BR 10289]MBW7973097.1 PaaI family thioesterase [Bradyrhizobium sp. BR 10289]